MKTVWTKGTQGPAREEIEREFLASASIRKRLSQLLEEKIEVKRVKKISEEEYASSSWAFKQADAVGYERALREVMSLIVD